MNSIFSTLPFSMVEIVVLATLASAMVYAFGVKPRRNLRQAEAALALSEANGDTAEGTAQG